MDKIVSLQLENSIAFWIGSTPIFWYGILIAIGFILAIGFACIKLEFWYKISCNPFYWFVFIGIPVSILGARFWSYVIGNTSWSTDFFGGLFSNSSNSGGIAGLAIEGGVMFTVIAALIYFPLVLRKPRYHVKTKIGKEFYVKQVSMWVYADAIVPCILVGQIIGRWGNFFNSEVFGPATTAEGLAWLKNFMPAVYYGMHIVGKEGVQDGWYQPFFLYESFFNFWFFILLYVGLEFVKQRKAGDLAIGYFICYGLLRTCMEPFRYGVFQFTTTIVLSVLLLVGGIVLLVCNHLVFAKHRDFKFWAYSWYQLKSIFSNFKEKISELKTKIHHDTNLSKNKNTQNKSPFMNHPTFKKQIKKQPTFYREPKEIFYFNGF